MGCTQIISDKIMGIIKIISKFANKRLNIKQDVYTKNNF